MCVAPSSSPSASIAALPMARAPSYSGPSISRGRRHTHWIQSFSSTSRQVGR